MATWYDEAWLYRKAIVADNSAGGTGTYSYAMTIPASMEDFWSYCQADGGDLILTAPDGFTPISVSNATALEIDDGAGGAFSGSTKAGRIRLDKYTGGAANSACVGWLYYGNAASSASNAFGAWSSPTTVTARMAREGAQRATPRIVTRPEAPGATVPRVTVVKASTETIHLYWDFGQELIQRDQPYEGSLALEGIKSMVLSAETGGVNNTAVITATDLRVVGRAGAVVRTTHPAGSSGTDYALKLKVTTTLDRVLDRRCVLSVYDPVEQGA